MKEYQAEGAHGQKTLRQAGQCCPGAGAGVWTGLVGGHPWGPGKDGKSQRKVVVE